MSVHEYLLEVERKRYPRIDVSSEVGSIRGEEEQPKELAIVDDCLFVAVGKEVKESKSTVIWALQNSGGKKIWILHVHTPAQTILSKSGKQEAMAHNEKERKEMLKTLDEYIHLCAKAGVNAQKLFIEADSVENGIITLVSRNMIGRIVMGAATDNRYKKGMTHLKSKKAIYVHLQAPSFCHILFVCKGFLIYTRVGVKPPDPDNECGETNFLRSQQRTETELSNNNSDIYQDRFKSRVVSVGGNSHDTDGWTTPTTTSNGSSSESEHSSRLRVFDSAPHYTSSDVIRGSPLSHGSDTPQMRAELALPVIHLEEEYIGSSSPPHLLQRSVGDDLYDRVDKLMAEVDNLKDEVIEATRKAKATEILYIEEKMRRNEFEEKFAKEKKEHELLKFQHTKFLEELQKSSLQREFEKSSIISLLEKNKKERDDLEIKLDNALLQSEHLKKQLAPVSKFFADFTHLEVSEATENFKPSRIIGEGGFGNIYKGTLRHTEVAIKVLSSDGLQGPQEFKQEVDTLSKLRHPNIVTLIGVCSEASALIYEYYPNGSLDYRLACKDNTPPISWQTRISIAAELCSVLMFLHSCQPESIIHGDLKPANVLLDARLSCKLSDFGICCSVYNGEKSTESVSRFSKTVPKGTFAYMDPGFVSTGMLTPKSDVYSFGIILLGLLTGKSAVGMINEVQNALNKDNLNSVLDNSGGEWPLVQANQLALLGLWCCEMQRHNRPDLEADVWRFLEPMRVSAGP